jgi:hypothetical protein
VPGDGCGTASASLGRPSAGLLAARVGREAGVDLLDLADERAPERVLEVEDLLKRPVEVISHVRHLLEQGLRAVRQDSPGRLRGAAEKSTANS